MIEFLFGGLIGFLIGVAVCLGLFNSCAYEPLFDQCVAEKTAACREEHAADTGAYLSCVQPIRKRCSP